MSELKPLELNEHEQSFLADIVEKLNRDAEVAWSTQIRLGSLYRAKSVPEGILIFRAYDPPEPS